MYLLRSFTVAACCLLPFAVAPAQAAVTFSSDAYDVGVHVNAGSVAVATADAGRVSGSAGQAYNISGGVASVNNNATLAGNATATATQSLQTGLVSSNARSDGASGNSAAASASLANVSFGMSNQLLGALSADGLLNLGANTISSMTTVGIDGSGLYGFGSSSLAGLTLTGSLLGSAIDGSAYSSPTANTVLLSLAGLKVILNEQIRSATGDGLAMQTNAVHIALNDYALNGSLLNGDIILGHSAAQVAGVPEPASWAMMIVGLGAIGAAMRRRRGSALFA